MGTATRESGMSSYFLGEISVQGCLEKVIAAVEAGILTVASTSVVLDAGIAKAKQVADMNDTKWQR